MPITEAKRSDVKMADAFTPNPGSIVAMDRGDNDCGLFFKWTAEKIYFVARLKENAAYELEETTDLDPTIPILSPQNLRFQAPASQPCPVLDSSELG